MKNRELRNRYSRQTMFPAIGDDGQEKLSNSNVVIIGCGALGTNIATFLVRAGVGEVKIIDRDFIEYHNLQRQVLFDEEDIKRGLPKAIAAERHLRKVNSLVKIKGIVDDVNHTNIEKLCTGYDVILDGLDNLKTRFLINDVALKHGIPWIYGGAVASHGMTMTIIPGVTPCLRCVHPVITDPASLSTCETAGIVNTVPAVISALQATEAIKLIVGEQPNKELISINIWNGTFDRLKIKPQKDCPACNGRYDFLNEKFEIMTTSLCGQSRAVQVVDTSINKIFFNEFSDKLMKSGSVSYNDFMLRFKIDDKEIIVFPNGRAIIRNTIDESEAKELYDKYIKSMITKTVKVG